MKTGFQKIILWFGTQKKLAAALNVRPQTVQAWSKGVREIPIKRCVQIEHMTNGAITRRDLRPYDWKEIWPELDDETEKARA